MDVNYFAVVRLTQPFIQMLKQSKGRVVIVSSVDGIVSLPGNAPYDGSKYAVEAYADALRVELSFWDVHVAVVNPATMRTPLALGFFEAHKKAWEMMEKQEPAGAWKETWTREWLDEYVAVNSKNLASIAQDPIHAIRDVAHGVAAKHPRMRYLSGTLAKTLFRALWKMPEEWSFVVKKEHGHAAAQRLRGKDDISNYDFCDNNYSFSIGDCLCWHTYVSRVCVCCF